MPGVSSREECARLCSQEVENLKLKKLLLKYLIYPNPSKGRLRILVTPLPQQGLYNLVIRRHQVHKNVSNGN